MGGGSDPPSDAETSGALVRLDGVSALYAPRAKTARRISFMAKDINTSQGAECAEVSLRPYYQEAGITIYHGDCREVLPQLSMIGAVITDPPYGIDYGRAGSFSASHGWGPWREAVAWDAQRPTPDIFTAILGLSVPTVIWGGNYFTDYLPPRMGWLAWDKGQREFSLADFELAWTSEQKASRCLVYPRGRALRDGKQHPTQKPEWVIKQSIAYLERPSGRVLQPILDPFMGSGTTLRAAKDMGRRAIGIEIEERYCEIAADRLRQSVLFGAGA